MEQSSNVPNILPGCMKMRSNFNNVYGSRGKEDVAKDAASGDSQLQDKGVFIHIVEDPAEHQNEQSAVLISVPTSSHIPDPLSSLELQEDVFSTAQVTVSVQYLACIPEDRATFFSNLSSAMNIRISEDQDCVTLHGAWSQILLTQETMRAYLASWKQQLLARDAYEAINLKTLDAEVKSEPTEVPKGSPMRTRHQEKLQKEKTQTRARRKSGRGDEGEGESSAPPRENKENEVHLSISLAEEPPSLLTHPGMTPSELIIVPGGSTDTKPSDRPKKNYEQLAPFKFFCNLCSFKSKRESHYQRHLERHQTVCNLYTCDTCSFTTIRLGHLRRHELTHCTNTLLSCSLCQYRTDDERHLARHRRIKHQEHVEAEPEKPLEVLSCNKCSYSTTKGYLFQRHLKVHTAGPRQQDPHSFQCEQCSYKTSRKEHYLRHVNNVHQNRRPYLCDFCGKAFKRPDALKQHGITHAEVDPTVAIFRCSFCNKGCRSQAHLNEHLAVHSNVRSFLCEICGLSFKTRSVQRKHVLTIHKNPHAFSCHRCLKKFNTKYALRRHMKQHSWKEDEQEEQQMIVVQEDKSNTLTVQVPDEILASLPPGAVAVPLFSVVPNKVKDETSMEEGVAAAEVLALQLRQLPECGGVGSSDAPQFLPGTPDAAPAGLLYVATTFERF